MFKRSLFNLKISNPCLALNFYLVLNTVLTTAFELVPKSENVLESKIANISKTAQESEVDLKSVEIIEQIPDEIEQSQIDTFEWRQAYRRRWTKSPSSENSKEQLEQEQNDDNLLNSLSVQKQQFSFRKIPVESPISLLLELNKAVSSETRFGDDFRDVMISGEYTERGSFDENLLKLTVQQILMLQNYGCWCPKLVKDKKSDAFCGETVDVIDGFCHSWARCKKCLTMHPHSCSNPYEGSYDYELSFFANAGVLSCDSLLQEQLIDQCDYLNCLCDAEMAVQLISNLDKMNHTYIGIDQDLCVQKDGGGFIPDGCCGDFPHPKTYSRLSHECVNGKLEEILGIPELEQSMAGEELNIVGEDWKDPDWDSLGIDSDNYRFDDDRIYYGQGEILDINDMDQEERDEFLDWK